MDVRDEIMAMTPRLRRYARGLVAGDARTSEAADTLVQATLLRAVNTRGIGGSADLTIRLFATVTQLHRESRVLGERETQPAQTGEVAIAGAKRHASGGAGFVPPRAPAKLAGALLALTTEEREALLLVALEGFDHDEAARILRIARPVLYERLTRARTALARHMGTSGAAAPASIPHLRLVVG